MKIIVNSINQKHAYINYSLITFKHVLYIIAKLLRSTDYLHNQSILDHQYEITRC